MIARHNYLPFGEEISSGVGLRTSGQGYGATDTNRQKYALTERDDSTGLDHTWWRKYESFSGRWTSPDPYANSAGIADPQSFNRYSYTENDPVNSVDPTGLLTMMECTLVGTMVINDRRVPVFLCRLVVWGESPIVPLDVGQRPKKERNRVLVKEKHPPPKKTQKDIDECLDKAALIYKEAKERADWEYDHSVGDIGQNIWVSWLVMMKAKKDKEDAYKEAQETLERERKKCY